MKIYKWQIYCETDGKYEEVLLSSSEPAPTKCPVDTTHTVTANSASIIQTINTSVQKTQQHIGADSIALLEFGFNFTAPKNSTSDNDKLLPVKYLRGAGIECEDHEFGDSITVQIVDADNILGYGAGFVLNEFGNEVQIPVSGLFKVLSESISNAIPTGVYIRMKYKSVGTTNDVKVRVNCRGYNDA